ncbi:hypothetical protein GQ457_05G013400 [Hibiscus cannabinus]
MWNRRNHLVHKSIILPVRVVVDYANDYVAAFDPSMSYNTCNRSDRWRGPPVRTVKFNVDGAYIQETGAAVIGVMIRNEYGLMIDGQAKTIPGIAELAEAWVFLEGIKMAAANEWTKVIIEGDSLGIINRGSQANS